MVLDSTRYAIERSARVLRGMAFWGKIGNAFSDDPQVRASGVLRVDFWPRSGTRKQLLCVCVISSVHRGG